MTNPNYAEAVCAVISKQMAGTAVAKRFDVSYPYLMQLVAVAKKQQTTAPAIDNTKEIADLKEQIATLQERLDERADTPEGKKLKEAHLKMDRMEDEHAQELLGKEEEIDELNRKLEAKAKPAAYQGLRTTLADVLIAQQAVTVADIALREKENEANYQKKLSATRIHDAVNRACPQ